MIELNILVPVFREQDQIQTDGEIKAEEYYEVTAYCALASDRQYEIQYDAVEPAVDDADDWSEIRNAVIAEYERLCLNP